MWNKPPRQGFLLKVQGQDFATGYSDCFPWPEFGDPTGAQALKSLSQFLDQGFHGDFQLSPLVQKSFYFAQRDGRARESKESLWDCQYQMGVRKAQNRGELL